ncbi:MAG: hypothetical protein ACK5ZT_10140 [Sphingobacteriaceae bacterium]|jgi:hypothetical protein
MANEFTLTKLNKSWNKISNVYLLYIYNTLRTPLYILITLTLVLLFSNCKKKEEETPIDPATGCTNCSPSYASSYYGILKAGTYTTTSPASSATITSRVSAFFSTSTITIPSVANSTTVNSVLFNSDTLVYSAAPYYYTNLTPISLSSITWSVNGAGTIPSFNYKNLKNKPSFSSLALMPDTVRKGLGFTVIINDLKDFTAASIYISDGLSAPSIFTKMLDVNSDTITFAPDNLTSIQTSTNGIITIFMENAHGIKVDSKDFKISNEAAYTKKVVIKN